MSIEKIASRLGRDYIYTDEVARVLALAAASGKNVLLWGPAGHGKSEMSLAALLEIASEDEIFIQSFGEGMDEATLWGGLDFAALESQKVLRYFPENSFLAKPFAVFEEIFDAPASVLLALKDTLTARVLRKGAQQYKMATKVIVALTNKAPGEISELGPAAHALIERFPLQFEVKWKDYSSASYLKLFQKVGPRVPGADLNGTMGVLAEVMAKAAQGNDAISPRTAVHALGVVKAAAAIRSSEKVEKQDLLDLCFLPGMQQFAATLRTELDAAYTRAAAEGELRNLEAQQQALLQEMSAAAGSPIKMLQVAKKFVAFQDAVSALTVPNGLTDRRKNLRDAASTKAAEAQRLAFEATRI